MRQLQKLQQLTMNFQGCWKLSDPMGPQWHPRESHGRPIGAPWIRPDAPLVIEVPGHPRQSKKPDLVNWWSSNWKPGPCYETWGKSKRKKGPCYEIGGNLMNTHALVTKPVEMMKSNNWKPVSKPVEIKRKLCPCLWNRWKSNEPGEISWKYGTSLRNRWTLR